MNSNPKRPVVICIGPTAKPICGETVAFVEATDAMKQTGAMTVVILCKGSAAGASAWFTTRMLLRFLRCLSMRPVGVYLTAGQSPKGLARDSLVLLTAALFRIPTIVHLHGGGLHDAYAKAPVLARVAIKRAFALASGIIVLSEHLTDQFRFLTRRPPLYVLPNWFSPRAPIIPPRGHGNVSAGRYAVGRTVRLLYLSNVLPSKGLFTLLDALLLLAERGANCELTFAGALVAEGAWTVPRLQKRIKEYEGLLTPARFVITGPVQECEKWRLLERADLVVLPTKFPKEGQPITLIEAMYAGCALLATPYRGIRDLIDPEANGWFVAPEDVPGLARVLAKLIAEPELLRIAGAIGYERARTDYAPEKRLSDLLTIIQTTFGTSRNTSSVGTHRGGAFERDVHVN